MNFDMEDLQAARLKQILFPRKVKTSRTSINTSMQDTKQNIQMNRTYTIKQQIFKLKQGIQNFMDKQPFTYNFLTTPRECLELIKCMGNNMCNYGQEIEEAVNTLIESIPPPLVGTLPSSKYFLTQVKLSYLGSVVHAMKRRILGSCLEQIKREAQQQEQCLQKQKQIAKNNNQKLAKYVKNKLFLAFNRWRLNSNSIAKQQIEMYTYQKQIVRSLKMIKLISDESRMVLWLQKLVQSNSNTVQLLLYNQKTATLRSYKLQSECLTSVFESVENQSRVSNLDESIQMLNSKIKRLQINLQHSLTKICLIKKQTMAIQQLRKDPDYSKIDDFSSLHGLSARQLTGGCIFTPIVYKNKSIGIIRQYFYDRLGEAPRPEIVAMIAQILENNIKTSSIFEEIKDKSIAIRKKYYLKAVLLLNFIEKLEVFSSTNEQQFDKLLSQYFPIKSLGQYSYQTINTFDKLPRFTVTPVKGLESELPDIVAALNKMNQSQSNFIYEKSVLYIRLPNKIFTFEAQKEENGDLEHIPSAIIRQLLQRKQLVKEKKQKEYKNYLELKRIAQKQEQEKHIAAIKNKILDYMLSLNKVQSGDDALKILQQYLHKFVHPICNQTKPEVTLIKKLPNKNYSSMNSDIILYEDQEIVINASNIKSGSNTIPQHILTPLIDLSYFLIEKLKKPTHIDFDSKKVDTQVEIWYKMDNIEETMTNLLINTMELSKQQIKTIAITKNENPFIASSYHCWLQKKYADISNPSTFIKLLKSQSSVNPISLNPLSSVICLKSQLMLVIDKYLDINQEIVNKLLEVYQYWQSQKQLVSDSQIQTKRNTNYIIGFHQMNKVLVEGKLRQYFYTIKNTKIKIRYIPNILENYTMRENKKSMCFAFNSIKNRMPKMVTFSLIRIQQGLHKISSLLYQQPLIRIIFGQYKKQKNMYQKISKFARILLSKLHLNINLAFNQLAMRKYIRNTNNLSILEEIVMKIKFHSFEMVRRFTKMKEMLQITQAQTQCSAITKLDSINKISQIIKAKFDNFQAYLYLKNGQYLSLSSSFVQTFEDFENKTGFQHYQFNCQPKSLIKYAVWLVPENHTISLIEKHYLQVLSRAIDEGFMKFIYKNQELICSLSHFVERKNKKLLHKSVKNLREFTMKEIKNEQYSWRNCFYQTNIQVQNYKIMQKQQRREQQQRMIEIQQALEAKRINEQNLSKCRKSIIRLEVSSRQLEQVESKSRQQLAKKQIVRAFNLWRVQTAGYKLNKNMNRLWRKKTQYASNCMMKIFKQKINENLNSSFKMLLLKSAQVKTKIISSSQKKVLEAIDQNRLLTFQDQLNQCFSDEQKQDGIQRQMKQQKQLSIIPISFKHFESSKKENFNVTDQQAKKLNGGAYKLNAKTLKFLKRMGKLNN